MCVEIFEKIMAYDVIKFLFHFYAIESSFNGISFDTTFEKFSFKFSHKQNSLTREIKVLGCPCDLMPARLFFFKSKVIIFLKLFDRFTIQFQGVLLKGRRGGRPTDNLNINKQGGGASEKCSLIQQQLISIKPKNSTSHYTDFQC